jgi:integration host factor subunit beta
MIRDDVGLRDRKIPTHRAVLTKAELIEEIALAAEVTRKEAALILELMLNRMVRALDTGDKVEIRGFGSFHTRPRKGRIGRNPKTGAIVKVPAKRIPYFKPSKELLELIQRR